MRSLTENAVPSAAIERGVGAESISDGIGRIHENRLDDASDQIEVPARRDKDSRSQAFFDGERRGVFGGDEKAAFRDEGFEVFEAESAESGAHVRGGADASEVRGEIGLLPRKRVADHRQSVDDELRADVADGGEDDDVVLRAQVGVFGDGLGADVGVGDVQFVEGDAPPALGLRV